MADKVQGGIFGGLDFQPLGWGSPTAPYNPFQDFPGSGYGGSGLGPPRTSITITPRGVPDGSQTGTPDAVKNIVSGNNGGTISTWDVLGDYFVRAVVIILGLIFVAVGLSMFRSPIINQVVGRR